VSQVMGAGRMSFEGHSARRRNFMEQPMTRLGVANVLRVR